MNRNVTISVECANVLRFRADVLVLKYADGLHGADRATHKQLTNSGVTLEMPKVGEWVVVETAGSVAPDHVMFGAFDEERLIGITGFNRMARQRAMHRDLHPRRR